MAGRGGETLRECDGVVAGRPGAPTEAGMPARAVGDGSIDIAAGPLGMAAVETASIDPSAAARGRTGEQPPVNARSLRERVGRILSIATALALLALAGWVINRWAAHVTLADLVREMKQIGARQLGLAIFFTALSFVALIGYEWYSVQFTGKRLPWYVLALYSFITQGIAHAAGFAIFVGATLRYKLYGGRGFDFFDVARIQLYFTTAFGLGVFTLGGIALLFDPGPLAAATEISTSAWRAAGVALLLAVAAVVLVGAVMHRRFRLFGHLVELPGFRATVLLIALGVADLMAVAAALHVLLPAELGLSFFATLNIFVAAIALGLISHVPGSLGVFEGAVILLVAPAPPLAAPLLGALIMFRAVYYMLPLVLSMLAFGVVELARLRRQGGAV